VPEEACSYSDLSLDYQTFVQAYWLYRVKARVKSDDWHLFYKCFHPTPVTEKKAKFEAKFPNDVPLLGNMHAMSTYEASKNLDPEDPAYWSSDRLDAALKGTELERRMAATDWDWYWYSRQIAAGKSVDMSIAGAKNRLDKILYELYDDKYEDSGSYNIEASNKYFIELKQLYKKLKDYLKVILIFD
jgi:hypothetical protein